MNRLERLEKEDDYLKRIIDQCGRCADPLYADFRSDIICSAMETFRSKGLRLKDLIKFGREVPAIYPWNLEYASLRTDVNRRFVVYPLIIVMTESEEDVIKGYRFARKYEIPITIRGGSHSFEGYSISSGMVIDQSRRKGIRLCIEHLSVALEAGVLLGPLADKLSQFNLAMVSGTCPNNGAIGYTLGGGIGFLARKFGLTCDDLISLRILIDNNSEEKCKIITVDQENNSDLFWGSCGGGGGNFGIVTEIKMKVRKISDVITFKYTYDFSQFTDVVTFWQNWAPFVDNSLTSELRTTNNRGNTIVSGLFLGTKEKLSSLLEPFDNLNPVSKEIVETSYVNSAREFSGNGRWLPFFKTRNAFIKTPFPKEAIEILQRYMSQGSGNDILEFNALQGKVSEIASDKTAFPHRDALFWMLINAHWNLESEQSQELKWINSLYMELEPYLNSSAYVNAVDSELNNYLEQYYGSNLERLIQVKRKYDPKNIFSFPQSIPLELSIL